MEIPRGLEPKEVADLADTPFIRERARANGGAAARRLGGLPRRHEKLGVRIDAVERARYEYL